MARTKTAQHLALVDQTISYAVASGVLHQYTEDEGLNGRTITVRGMEVVNFGSCSYLGLEQDERMKMAAIEAIRKYGVQFSSSRAYMSIGLYKQLEHEVEKIFGGHAIVSPSVTMAHLSAIPVIVEENDVVILDHQVHTSVQMTAQLLKARGIKVELIRHNRLDMLEARVKKLSQQYRKVWYMADGVYSMFGDYAPVEEIKSLLNQYPALHLYIDDAHGVSWFGKNGKGVASTFMGGHEKVYIAASLNKSFAAGGGAVLFPNAAIADKVRKCGSTYSFSGPLQPASIGAAIASAKIHQSSDLPVLQQRLAGLIDTFNTECAVKGLYQPLTTDTPIGFIRVGDVELTLEVIQRLMRHGYYVNSAIYPAVPYKESGLRITINNHLRTEDIVGLLECVKFEIPRVEKKLSQEKESFVKMTQRHP
ncbi:MAG: aminotransferase class I/II-fold pyridoxal phosphate-dependent enzyme [Bacteroidota bacterium]